MSRPNYNRDQRNQNRIIDVLVKYDAHTPGLSLDVLYDLTIASEPAVHILGDMPKARMMDALYLLVEFGAVRREEDIDGDRYFIGQLPKVLEVARGEAVL